jgi:hypothetical protein
MNPENDARITIPRIVVSLEIIFGLLLPALVVGPFVVLGLIFGIATAATAPITFLLSAFGAYGLLGTAILLSSSDKISRKRAEIASAGVISGTLVGLYIFIGMAAEGRHWDKQTVFLCVVLMASALVGLRRVILLWKNPPF